MSLTWKDWTGHLADADDLDAVVRAVARERVIRNAMRETGESRDIVADMLDASVSMDQEAVLDLMEGEPTTLHAGLQRYVQELEGRDELQPRDRVVGELDSLLAYPWPGSVRDVDALTREIHDAYVRLSPARGFEMVEWHRLSSEQRDLALAVVAYLGRHGVLVVKD